MRICVIRNSDGPMNAQLIRIGTALSQTHHEFFFITRTRESNRDSVILEKEMIIDGKAYKNYEIQLPAMIGGGMKNILPLLKYTKILTTWLKKNHNQYDAIHAIDYDTGSVALKVAKKYNKKFIYHIADFYADSRLKIPVILKKYLRKKEYNVINHADATIVCTDDRKNQIIGSHPKKLVVIHNTPPRKQEAFATEPQMHKEQLTLTYVGGLEKKRFIDQIIPVIRKHPNYRLVLAGAVGDAREIIDTISKEDQIEYLGKVSYEKALSLYQDTDIMFAMYDPNHPNHRFSAANKVYEAMLYGKPIIVANHTSMDQIVRTEDMGYTVDFNQQAFSNLLEDLVEKKEELYRKSKNAYKAYPKYSWEEMENRIIQLYKEIESN